MNIGVITGYDAAMREIGELTSDRLSRYCAVNGYDCSVHRNSSFDKERPAPWTKVRLIQAAIRTALYDWVCWVDADALLLRMDVQLESAIDPDKRLMLARDDNGVNTGFMLIKADVNSFAFMAALYAQTDFINHRWWEQAALQDMLNRDAAGMSEWTGYLEKKLWNAYPWSDSDENSIIAHAPSLPLKERLRLLRKYAHATA